MSSTSPPPPDGLTLTQVSTISDEYSQSYRRNQSRSTSDSSSQRVFCKDQAFRPLSSTTHNYSDLSLPPYFISAPKPAPTSSSRRNIRPHWPSTKTRTMPFTSLTSSSAVFWLALYFFSNLALTLYNKIVLMNFPFPYTLTALHALCGSIGTFVILHWEYRPGNPVTRILNKFRSQNEWRSGRAQPLRHYQTLAILPGGNTPAAVPGPIPPLRSREVLVLLLFSVLYTVNIVVSNASLRLVTVPFHQVVRASAPLFTIILSALLLGKYSSRAKAVALVPVIAGVGFATYGDYYFTPRGFLLTLLGTLLAALKTIFTNLLQKPAGTPVRSPPTAPFIFPQPKSNLSSHMHSAEKLGDETGLDSPTPSIDFKQYGEYDSGELQTNDPMSPSYPPYPSHFPPQQVSPIPSFYSQPLNFVPEYSKGSPLKKYSFNLPSPTSSPLKFPRLSLTPLQLLYLLSPLAFIQTTLLAHFSGELRRVNLHLGLVAQEYQKRSLELGDAKESGFASWNWGHASGWPRVWLLLNGVLAFLLNIVSFNANRRVGPLGMSVAANVKQVLAVLCSVTLFNLTITPTNGLGILLTLVGGAWYAAVELRERRRGA